MILKPLSVITMTCTKNDDDDDVDDDDDGGDDDDGKVVMMTTTRWRRRKGKMILPAATTQLIDGRPTQTSQDIRSRFYFDLTVTFESLRLRASVATLRW